MSSASSPSAALISAIRAQSSSLNLLPLQRIDGAIQAVVLTAKHSVLYMLDQDTEKWEREDVEGPFFLVERSSPPYYAMVILNRRSIDNFFQEIRASMAFEIQEHYLFFQVNDDVIGVWFYEQPEAVQAAEALNGIVRNLQNPSFRPPPPPPSTPTAALSQSSPNSSASAPKAHSHPAKAGAARKAPPVIVTQPGKRLHKKAPPPPSLEFNAALSNGDERVLERRLGEFIKSFNREDDEYRRAHEEEVKRIEDGRKQRPAVDAPIPLPLDALFRAAQDGALPPMPAASSNGVKGITSAEELERSLAGRDGQREEDAQALPPLLSQMFLSASAPPAAPPNGDAPHPSLAALLLPPASPPPSSALLTPASLLAQSSHASAHASPSPAPLITAQLTLPPLPPHLTLADFRRTLSRLVADDGQLRAWHAQLTHAQRPVQR